MLKYTLAFEDVSDLEWEPEPDLPEYGFDGRAYHVDDTRWPEYDATIYSGEE